ncbi:hypothetical protein CEUSTIGMA_g951.t1 [Chlamydomonas eustigma]|uniref:STI1 domain-containing protein n=1 Tax=Chlamydomonas eustigma TaxID=1157962 RepID=A0A250WS30_9CHLO|nr:hypothetical protein CEUSTIGMA_g951.t1 [Chlamydomonas eustigma]|eukprot:GAX73499.1 hypothetical protein CEUSTIGMA_g951.t1 [Chlamydomonas eustigma]
MLELMTSSPQMQQVMMASLPPEARSPEAIKQMLQHPGIKQKLVEMIAHQKLPIPSHVLDQMTPGHMEATFQRASKLGVDPQQLFSRLVSHPELLKKLQQPKIMTAFMDMSRNPQNASMYANDAETMEVVQEIRQVLDIDPRKPSTMAGSNTPQQKVESQSDEAGDDVVSTATRDAVFVENKKDVRSQEEVQRKEFIARAARIRAEALKAEAEAVEAEAALLIAKAEEASPGAAVSGMMKADSGQVLTSEAPQQAVHPPPPGSPPSSGSFSSSIGTNVDQMPLPGPGAGLPGNVLTLLMSDPELMKKMQNPKVQKAVMEISKSPWKTIKYVFDREVMEVFSALNNIMRGKDPWSGKGSQQAAKSDTPPPTA